MAVVLPAEESDYFRPTSSLRRSQSQTQFASPSTTYHASAKQSSTSSTAHSESYHPSDSSSASSSPRTVHAESVDVSYASTPATAFSVVSDYEEALSIDEAPEDHFTFPSYAQDKFFLGPGYHRDDSVEPPPSPLANDADASCAIEDDSAEASGPGTPDPSEHAEDDTAVVSHPSRQVDYLSHDWREEDIWSSWRYIVSRRGEFSNSARLENASWRTWMKAKNNLKTISPETLNWLKDCDVTWLYGPLQQIATKPNGTATEPSSRTLSKSESLINLNKKPILKKRSMSEMMLQRSISTASLLKQATAAVQAQETRMSSRPSIIRAQTDFGAFSFSARRSSHGTGSSLDPSVDSSGLASPSVERKHIHFNEQVEQCIAVEVKGDDDDDMDAGYYARDSDSDDGFMMKKTKTKKRPLRRRGTKKAAKMDGPIIAMLPSTTLKYREDTPEPRETAMKHSTGISHSPVISPSPSEETLRPSKESTHFFFGDEDEAETEDSILNSKPGWRSPPFDTSSAGMHRSASSGSLTDEPAGMRRTESGMLMPYEETGPAASGAGDGIFGRVVDTVNTARDIAHVIWNVGWRK
ncbi:hypothetical protein NLU13_9128 [Sarocladium strictum]|uniref:Nitrogen regulatory protein areA GATA-like domain-containing protein n=1 Tax=Sarocladium strictum TaxID=5046 RepID=A0AA39G9J4_SARSR|nr:hypothetical protein NLU13_9128 [Sarocladium strictum]